jgi:hypothetical protein
MTQYSSSMESPSWGCYLLNNQSTNHIKEDEKQANP